MPVVFDAGRQLLKVRFIMILSLVAASGATYAGIQIARTYGLSPADGGVLKPLTLRLAFGTFVALLGIGFAVGMWVYGRCYVARLTLEPETRTLLIETVTFWGRSTSAVSLTEVQFGERHAGRFQAAEFGVVGASVNAPWRELHVRGRSLPLIVDEQGRSSRDGKNAGTAVAERRKSRRRWNRQRK